MSTTTFTESDLAELIQSLDQECWSCRDHGEPIEPRVKKEGFSGKCSICDGSGFILTDGGEVLLKFIRRHHRPVEVPL